MSEYIERGAVLAQFDPKTLAEPIKEACRLGFSEEKIAEAVIRAEEIAGIVKDGINAIPAADVVKVVRCVKCKYGTPLKAHADGVYGLHCAIGRGEEVRNVWHKYSKHYEDYSLVDVDGFCDQGEAGEPSIGRSGSGE